MPTINTSRETAPDSISVQTNDDEQANLLTAMLTFNLEIAMVRNRKDFQHFIDRKLKILTGFDFIGVAVVNPDNQTYSPFVPQEGEVFTDDIVPKYSLKENLFDLAINAVSPVVAELPDAFGCTPFGGYLARVTPYAKILVSVGLRNNDQKIGALFLVSSTPDHLSARRLISIQQIAIFLSAVISNIIAYETVESQVKEIFFYKQQLESENIYLQEEIQHSHNYNDIVGSSPVMRKVFQMVSQVAPTKSSVLILGETGTGKELIARAIHNTSPRKNKVMIKVNCASLPANLIESELFGHELGSFTGATQRRIGKFELANNSTLFLDEIGELAPDLQVKLLRALQEKEIERIGGTGTIKINVRIIAATNRNLQREVQQGKFRSDLYFRLNVFPILIPPLRERRDDITMLANHFLNKYARNGSSRTMNFSSRVIKQLGAYNWPGNVRELEHLVERSVLLATGNIINNIFLPTDREEDRSLVPDSYIKTIDEIEREYIISILKKSKGKIAGIGGAAEMLNIPSTTLNSKIKRLKILKGYTES